MNVVLDWPTLNQLVWLKLPCCAAEHPSRVEDFVDDYCVVAAPSIPHTRLVDPARAKDGAVIGWVTSKGPIEVPVDVVDSTAIPIPLWTLRATGPSKETQRRNFVRLDMDTSV